MAEVTDTVGTASTAPPEAVFFFDIDNCLYSRDLGVQGMMSERIDGWMAAHLGLPHAEAARLHLQYYREYGLAVEGLVRHHGVDALAYNRAVDDTLPLDGVMRPDPALRRILEAFDRRRVRLWLFTNAYATHARRVVRLLGLEGCFDGMTFADYGRRPLVCKPAAEAFDRAEREAGVRQDVGAADGDGGGGGGGKGERRPDVYFVDDSRLNCTHAEARGWRTVHKIEPADPVPAPPACRYLVRDMAELPALFPQLFRPEALAAITEGRDEK